MFASVKKSGRASRPVVVVVVVVQPPSPPPSSPPTAYLRFCQEETLIFRGDPHRGGDPPKQRARAPLMAPIFFRSRDLHFAPPSLHFQVIIRVLILMEVSSVAVLPVSDQEDYFSRRREVKNLSVINMLQRGDTYSRERYTDRRSGRVFCAKSVSSEKRGRRSGRSASACETR